MAVFTKKKLETGQTQYRKDGNLVKKADIDEKILAKLDIVGDGVPVSDSDEVVPTNDNPVAETPKVAPEKLVTIHLERNHMVNGKVYLGGYNVEVDPETKEVISEEPIEIKVTKEMSEELRRNDRLHSNYERNLMRGQNMARVAPQVKDVKA